MRSLASPAASNTRHVSGQQVSTPQPQRSLFTCPVLQQLARQRTCRLSRSTVVHVKDERSPESQTGSPGANRRQRDLYENYRTTTPWDKQKEADRHARRMTFTFDDWKRHRSSHRYLYHVKTLVESGIVRGIAGPVLLVTLFTAVVAALNVAHAAALLPAWVPTMPCIAIEPVQLTSIALSLLLVFRTNASYARWDEGRRSFGAITTVSRDIARQAFAWFRTDDADSRARLGRWLVALGRCTMVHLREEHNMEDELRGVLEPSEVEAVISAMHAPSFCLQMISYTISKAGLPQELVIRMDENVSRLTDAVSACERILNTPIPLSYTRHTARFLMAWLACLPFCLWSYCGPAMVPIAALVAFVLLGIEEIGVYIEEPFSILALEKLVNKLENIINAMGRDCMDLERLARGPTAGIFTSISRPGSTTTATATVAQAATA